MLQLIVQADDVLHRLLVSQAEEMTNALQVAEEQQIQIERLREANKKISGVVGWLHGRVRGTA